MIPNKVNIVIEVPEEKEVMIEEKKITEGKGRSLQSLKEVSIQNNYPPKVQIESELLSSSSKFKLIKSSTSFEDEENKNERLDPEQKSNGKSDKKIEMTRIDDQIENAEVEEDTEEKDIGFWKAWLLPGVIPFAICIAFVK